MSNRVFPIIFQNRSTAGNKAKAGAVLFLLMAVLAAYVPARAESLSQGSEDIKPVRSDSAAENEHPQYTGSGEEICPYYDIIVFAAQRHKVDAALVMAIIRAESRYDPNAVSSRGAQGLMQLMPQTAEALGVIDSFDPEQNVDAGVRYFKRLLKIFDGDRDLALAAYNAGLQNVLQHGGIPPFPATRQYIHEVWSWYDRYKTLQDRQSSPAIVSVNEQQ